jgi:hypothetical protein
LALQNKKFIYSLLLRASAETLLEVACDPRHLGAEIGFFSVLHTWNHKLGLHPPCPLRHSCRRVESRSFRRALSLRLNAEQNSFSSLLSATCPMLSRGRQLPASSAVPSRTVSATLYTAVSPHSICIGSASAATTTGFLLAA